jgi:hypothetical protein
MLLTAVVAGFALGWWASMSSAAPIEADPNKNYILTKRHGPWTIMVCSFTTVIPPSVPAAEVRREVEEQRKNAEVAAHDLVIELRQLGIPAYVFRQHGELSGIDTTDRTGRTNHSFVAHRNQLCVLAGNYPSADNTTAQKTLKYIQNYEPKALSQGTYKKTPGRKGPLGRAFLALNPLLSPEEVKRLVDSHDPLLLKLNSRGDYNLVENPGKYTVIVASFYGKKQTRVVSRDGAKDLEAAFDRSLETGSSLDQAGVDAWELVRAMRSPQNIDKLKQLGVEPYVFHDRHRSIVTVGAFDSPNDPRIHRIIQAFRAKVKRAPDGRQEGLYAEAIQLKKNPNNPDELPIRQWILDPEPQVYEVPRLR